MTFYYGTSLEKLVFDASFYSRYKVPIIFLSSTLKLAENFALFAKSKTGKGFVHEIEVSGNPIIHNFNNTTFSGDFRNGVYKFIKGTDDFVLLKNCNDRPNDFYNFELADIAMIADFNLIKTVKLLQEK